jgi:hypothetical protein
MSKEIELKDIFYSDPDTVRGSTQFYTSLKIKKEKNL